MHVNAVRSRLTTALQMLSQKTLLISCKHKVATLYPSTSSAARCQRAGQGEQEGAARNQLQDWGYHHRRSTWENQAKASPERTKPC